MLISFMIIVFLAFFVIISSRIIDMYDDNNRRTGEDMVKLVENEIKLAKASENGYYRTFKLPQKLDGDYYATDIIENRELVVNFKSFEHVTFLPEKVCGDTFIGVDNSLMKEDGWVALNSYWTYTQCDNMNASSLCDLVEETFPGTKCWCCNVHGKCCPS